MNSNSKNLNKSGKNIDYTNPITFNIPLKNIQSKENSN